MQIQKIFKAGNSNVVAIPSNLVRELGIKVGEEVYVEKSPVGASLLISKVEDKTKKDNKSKSSKEFKKWLKTALEEDKEILDELAIR